jgi:hypothetical protein
VALSREPRAEESTAMRKFLESEAAGLVRENPALKPNEANQRALVQMCRVILNLNEFVYPQ